ncbi:MAG TPA: lysine 5,6-aminomutase subunit alpha, partial [Soehngenia sp.]|nr:lysine 5,6-aminomutase subunit alpha [Soehngenia sp.]
MGKLNLDVEKINKSRQSAKNIADEVQKFIDLHTTVATERTVVRLLGVDGVDEIGKPLPNVVVDNIKEGGGLQRGAAYWMGNAIANLQITPQEIAEKISKGEIDITRLPAKDEGKIREVIYKIASESVEKIRNVRKTREHYLNTLGEGPKPYLYVIVATGNIYEDIIQAKAAAKQGADVIAVIRTTGQSLLDYVPYGATTEGFGGTYATQENFRLMRRALDEVGEEVGRYIRLTNYCSGLCMPEIAAMGAVERLDMMLNDALYGILFRDINMQRTLIDQYFSRV